MRQAGGAFAPEPSPIAAWAIPAASIVAGSLITILPLIATFPVLPPLGLMTLLAWRLLRPDTVRIWSPLPLGLFDDLVSGQPLGSAILLWTVSLLVVDLLDQRLMSRDFWQDWVLASGAIGACLIIGRLIATPLEAHVDTLLLFQVIAAVLLYPFVARLVGWLDAKRGRA
ncbi:rod shape-determining protein MreD [Sphingomonas bacterium]|uniref:rod shape-determining protein MreD n=1 Tax=Sphingomonas bacterium TaxID=1895847 RepID=UPI002616A775|nr:rod shape-determining protein MreD [Sphingomonas bacterium]MDB5678140.1 rod shape-determining protein MreD [Sphingomonas bacterium]